MSKIMIVVIFCSAVFSLVSSAAIKKEQPLEAWDDGNIDWDDLFRTTRRWEPFTWEPVTWEPVTWKTWEPFTWKPFTLKPFDEYYPKSDSSSVYLVVFFIIFVFVAFILLCLILSSIRRCGSSTRNSSRYPPSVVVPTLTGATTENTHVVLEFMPHPLLDPNNSVATSSVVDRPPGYDDVALGDLLQENTFPGVKPSIPETPPPNYTPAPNYTAPPSNYTAPPPNYTAPSPNYTPASPNYTPAPNYSSESGTRY